MAMNVSSSFLCIHEMFFCLRLEAPIISSSLIPSDHSQSCKPFFHKCAQSPTELKLGLEIWGRGVHISRHT